MRKGPAYTQAVEQSTGEVFCEKCDDMVYSDTLEAAARNIRLRAEEISDKSCDQSSAGLKRRAAYTPWSGQVDAEPVACRGTFNHNHHLH